MKLPFLSVLVAGAALVEVGASPLRVIVVTNSQEVSPKLRFGHAAGHHNINSPVLPAGSNGRIRRPCGGGRIRQKAVEISNAFRKALGFPLIDNHVMPVRPVNNARPDGMVHILPFVGTPPTFLPVHESGKVIMLPHPHGHPQDRLTHHMEREPFSRRLHFALMALGPWEGRAVAFVLGCGIGVLLRMLWVLCVISYRIVRGGKEKEHNYAEIIVVEEYDAGETAPAPPTYTYSDEKADKDAVATDTEAK